MAIATLSIDLVAKLASFEAGMDKAARTAEKNSARIDSAMSGLKKSIAGLGIAALVSAQISSAKATIDTLDKLDDLGEKYGIAADKLSAYRYASEVAGTTTEAFAEGLNKLGKNAALAAGGNREAASAFKTVGISVRDANGHLKTNDELLLELADKFAGYEDSGYKAALAQKFFGKTGADMIPLLNKGRDGISELTDEAKKLGAVYGNDIAKAAGDFNDGLKKLELASEAAKVSLLEGLLPTLVNITNQLIEGKKAYGSFLAATLDIGLEVDPLKSLNQNLTDTVTHIATLRQQMAEMEERSKSTSLIDRFNSIGSDRQAQKIRDQIALLEKRETYLRRIQLLEGGDQGRGKVTPLTQPKQAAPVVTDTKESEKALKVYEDLIKSITEKTTASEAELATGEKLSESQKFALDVVTKLASTETKLTDAQKVGVTTTLERFLATEKMNESQRESIKAISAESKGLADETAKRTASNKTLSEQIEEIGLNKDQLQELTLQRLENKAAIEAENIAALEQFGIAQQIIDQRKENLDLLSEDIRLRREAAAKTKANAADPLKGATDAVTEYLDNVQRAGDATKEAVSSSINALESDLTASLANGKIDVSSFINTIISEFYRLQVVRPLLASIFGGASGTGDGWASMLGSLFGGGNYAANGATGYANAAGISGGRASGGPVAAGKAYLVGERGPEVLRMGNSAGTVVPNHALGGGAHIDFSGMQINIADGVSRSEAYAGVRSAIADSEARITRLLRARGVL
jgi:lambda family phage tail tape measure protein